ncbi:hypothetical protein TorRG33x02_224940 [Trema orientale]|uniref:Uncharacterized protein n=1 Tax=Trema orientale TaxID=63057 RepID=A0A2P5E803_TREOI|nr:hypothetical protein TorRG33x02_224940 [Trema orientale]
MASRMVSMTFLVPVSASNSSFKEIHPRKSALGRVLSQPTYRTVTKLSISFSVIEGIPSMSWSGRHHILTPYRRPWEIVSCHMDEDSCTHMIIAGYWVGPDVDDGWGYVEAFVNPIT